MTKISKKSKQTQLERIDDNMLYGSLNILDGVLDFADLNPEDEEPPASWVERYGEEDAWKRFRLARVGWLPSKNLPSGVKIASTLVTEVLKAKMMAQAMNRDQRDRPLKKPKVQVEDVETDVEQFGEVQVDE
jgi:hypothetical protein